MAEMMTCTNGRFDLAGFSVGVVEKANIIDGQNFSWRYHLCIAFKWHS